MLDSSVQSPFILIILLYKPTRNTSESLHYKPQRTHLTHFRGLFLYTANSPLTHLTLKLTNKPVYKPHKALPHPLESASYTAKRTCLYSSENHSYTPQTHFHLHLNNPYLLTSGVLPTQFKIPSLHTWATLKQLRNPSLYTPVRVLLTNASEMLIQTSHCSCYKPQQIKFLHNSDRTHFSPKRPPYSPLRVGVTHLRDPLGYSVEWLPFNTSDCLYYPQRTLPLHISMFYLVISNWFTYSLQRALTKQQR